MKPAYGHKAPSSFTVKELSKTFQLGDLPGLVEAISSLVSYYVHFFVISAMYLCFTCKVLIPTGRGTGDDE